MAYRIATNADNLEFNNGSLSGYTLGGFTAAIFLKRNTLGTQQAGLFLVISGFTFPRFEFGFNSANIGLLVTRGSSASTSLVGPSVASSSLWYLLVVTGNGTATPRWHLHDGTSWAHSNASGPLTNNPTVGATDRLFLSPPSGWGGEYLKADVVCCGFKKADSADLTVENLTPTAFSSWQAFGFDWLVGFDASTTRTNQGSGTGGGEIARTGTSLVADPPGWAWAPAGCTVQQITHCSVSLLCSDSLANRSLATVSCGANLTTSATIVAAPIVTRPQALTATAATAATITLIKAKSAALAATVTTSATLGAVKITAPTVGRETQDVGALVAAVGGGIGA